MEKQREKKDDLELAANVKLDLNGGVEAARKRPCVPDGFTYSSC